MSVIIVCNHQFSHAEQKAPSSRPREDDSARYIARLMNDPHIFLDDEIESGFRDRVSRATQVPASEAAPPLSDDDLWTLASLWDRYHDGKASTKGKTRRVIRSSEEPSSTYEYNWSNHGMVERMSINALAGSVFVQSSAVSDSFARKHTHLLTRQFYPRPARLCKEEARGRPDAYFYRLCAFSCHGRGRRVA